MVPPKASIAKDTWCKGQFVYIENCMGKSHIVKKMCDTPNANMADRSVVARNELHENEASEA